MARDAKRLLEELLELPRAERIELFDRLGESLAATDGPVVGEAWRDEIRRRIAEVDAGTSELTDVEIVERELWAAQDEEEANAANAGR